MARIVLDPVADGRGSEAPTLVTGSLTTEGGEINPFVGWAEPCVLCESSISTDLDTTRSGLEP
ncbi:MAG: hypothetical protein RL119_561 [Actinomycetota bacterium]|jgi:hypothetical protein